MTAALEGGEWSAARPGCTLPPGKFYVPPLPSSIPELKVRIRTATVTITVDMLQTVRYELDYRVDVCRITKGAHIEHL